MTWIYVFDILGTSSSIIGGVLTDGKKFDVVGTIIIGMKVTAVGGGVGIY
jgi:uncharacterized membrane protein YeiH